MTKINNPQNIEQLFGLSSVPDSQKETQVIKQELYDTDLYLDMLDFSPALQDIVARGNDTLATFDYLAQDVYLALFKLHPELNPDERIKPICAFNKSIITSMLDNEDFSRMHAMTRLDSVAAGLGTQVLAEKTLEQLEEMINNSTGKHSDNTPTNSSRQENHTTPPHSLKNESFNGFQENISKACSKALKEVEQTMDMAKSWGIDSGDDKARISYHNKKTALERLRNSSGLKKLTDLVGNLRQVAVKTLKKGLNGLPVIKGVSTGSDMEMVLPSEKMLLSNETTKTDFFRRYHQGELLQYKSEGIYPQGRGPMVVCVDVSGSKRGDKEAWAKAMTIALAEVARRGKRDFACIIFDNKVVDTWIIPRGIWDPVALMDMAEKFSGGGTIFRYPLEKSLEIINTSPFRKAGIIMITDGIAGIDDDLLQELNRFKKRKGLMIITVLIDTGDSSTRAVECFSDEVLAISSLTGQAEVADGKIVSYL